MTTPIQSTSSVIVPLEILQGLCGEHLQLEDVSDQINNRSTKPRRSQLILVSDSRRIEIGLIRYRPQWARYVFEPRDRILLTEAFLDIVSGLTDLLSANYATHSELKTVRRDPLLCSPAINLTRFTATDRRHFISTYNGQ